MASEVALGRADSNSIWNSLVKSGMLAADGKLQPSFDPTRVGFTLQLPEPYQAQEKAVIDVLASYQIERHIRRERDEGQNRLRKEVIASPEFLALWEKIKPRTTYRVEFDTDVLVSRAVQALRKMEKIERVVVNFATAEMYISRAGVKAEARAASTETLAYRGPLPDVLAYLQSQTGADTLNARAHLERLWTAAGFLPESTTLHGCGCCDTEGRIASAHSGRNQV